MSMEPSQIESFNGLKPLAVVVKKSSLDISLNYEYSSRYSTNIEC